MRLWAPIPEDWPRRRAAGWDLAALPGWSERCDVILAVGPLEPLPPVPDAAWLAARVRGEVPPGWRLQPGPIADSRSSCGWPITRFELSLVDEHGALREVRLGAHYQLLEWGAVIEARAREGARLAEHRDQLLAIVCGARPDWSGEIAALCQILPVPRRAPPGDEPAGEAG